MNKGTTIPFAIESNKLALRNTIIFDSILLNIIYNISKNESLAASQRYDVERTSTTERTKKKQRDVCYREAGRPEEEKNEVYGNSCSVQN